MKYVTQKLTEPAFPKLLWSKPETKQSAGKILLLGGNIHGISAPVNGYKNAIEAGAGVIRIALPKSLKSVAGQLIEQCDYLPSTPSGSFSKQGLSEIAELSQWADAVFLAGDFGRNSETAALIESFINENTSAPIIITKDGFDYISLHPHILESSDHLIYVVTLSQLQKYVKSTKLQPAITHDMTQLQFAHALEELTIGNKSFITANNTSVFVGVDGKVSITNSKDLHDGWQLKIAAFAAVWLAQQPQKRFESLTTAVFEALQSK